MFLLSIELHQDGAPLLCCGRSHVVSGACWPDLSMICKRYHCGIASQRCLDDMGLKAQKAGADAPAFLPYLGCSRLAYLPLVGLVQVVCL